VAVVVAPVARICGQGGHGRHGRGTGGTGGGVHGGAGSHGDGGVGMGSAGHLGVIVFVGGVVVLVGGTVVLSVAVPVVGTLRHMDVAVAVVVVVVVVVIVVVCLMVGVAVLVLFLAAVILAGGVCLAAHLVLVSFVSPTLDPTGSWGCGGCYVSTAEARGLRDGGEGGGGVRDALSTLGGGNRDAACLEHSYTPIKNFDIISKI
jgi:hypothetical protein